MAIWHCSDIRACDYFSNNSFSLYFIKCQSTGGLETVSWSLIIDRKSSALFTSAIQNSQQPLCSWYIFFFCCAMWLIGILVSWTGIEPVPPAVDVWRPNYWCENAQSLSHVWLFCNPMDCSPSDSSVQGILQARILEWAVISSFRGSSQPRDWTRVFYVSFLGRQILYYWATWEAPNHWIAREFPACTLIIFIL